MPQSLFPRAATIAATGCLALAVAACHSGNKQASASSNTAFNTSLDPCSLLTADQVSQAIGTKVGAGKPQKESLSESRSCSWDSQTVDYQCATDVTGVVLEVVAPPPALKPRYPNAQSYFSFLLSTLREAIGPGGGSIEKLPGIGDEAFAKVSATKKGLDVYGRKGGTIVRVFSICGREKALQPELEQLLKQALAKT